MTKRAKSVTPQGGARELEAKPSPKRRASELLRSMSALEMGEGPIVDIARERLRDEARAMGMAIVSYTITEEPIPDPAIEALPRGERDRLLEITRQMYINPAGQLAKLEEMVSRYPHIPILRNHLGVALSAAGEHERADAVAAALAREFPKYVFGVCNYVVSLLRDGKVVEARAIVETGPRGPLFTLLAIDPGRTTFHVSEVVAHAAMVGHYMLCTDRVAEARVQLKLLKDVAPMSPQVESLTASIERRGTLRLVVDAMARMKADAERREERRKARAAKGAANKAADSAGATNRS